MNKKKHKKHKITDYLFYITALFLLIIILSLAFLQINNMKETDVKLLAANEQSKIGSIAEGELKTDSGRGKIYIENNLLSDTDTQLSIRMANELVCSDYADCGNRDFFYTVKSPSSLITGPSGGLGFAVMTYAHVKGYDVPEDVSFTGTINSGGFIGNVGGIQKKIRGASEKGIKIIYIPFGNRARLQLNNSNQNITVSEEDIFELAAKKGVEIIETPSLDQTLNDLYGYDLKSTSYEAPKYYTNTMQKVSSDICKRANAANSDIKKLIGNQKYLVDKYKGYYNLTENNTSNNTQTMSLDRIEELTNITLYYNKSKNLLEKADVAIETKDYYSASSYCFGSLLNSRYLLFLNKGYEKSLNETLNSFKIAKNMQKYEIDDSNEIQIYSVVQERINDAQTSLEKAYEEKRKGNIIMALDKLSYAKERFFTAISWSRFYDVDKGLKITEDRGLKDACIRAMKEANSRLQYVKLYFPLKLDSSTTYDKAKKFGDRNNFPLCIFYSLQSKAQSDVVASTFGWSSNNISKLLKVKSDLAKSSISSQIDKERLPVLSVSYIEYADSLKKTDPFSALLYYQMAQEFSNLDLYFDVKTTKNFVFNKQMIFLLGLSLGLILASIGLHSKKK